jgi:hypothetical protein
MSPLLLPKQLGVRYEANFSGRPAIPWGTALTSDTVAHTLPAAYTELIASTAFDSDWVNIWFNGNNVANTRTDSLVNIYVGAGSSEQLLIPNLLAGWTFDFPSPVVKSYGFPLRIPAGSRLSARHQSVRTSQAVSCMVELLGGGAGLHWAGTRVEAVGAVAGSSQGTAVTAGGASEGTLTSIGTSTYDWGFVLPGIGGNTTDTSMNAGNIVCDLGSGASTTIPGLEQFNSYTNSSEGASPIPSAGGRFCHVPAATTLYLRAQTSAVAEAQDWIIYGVA